MVGAQHEREVLACPVSRVFGDLAHRPLFPLRISLTSAVA
jgi:hypothetical protein